MAPELAQASRREQEHGHKPIEDDVRAQIAVEVAERIIAMTGLHAIPYAESLTAKVGGEVVTVSGTVRSINDHSVALAAPGVAHLRHEIRLLG